MFDPFDPRLKRVNIVGVPITATNMHDCLKFVIDEIDNIRGEYICVSNVHTTVMAHDDPNYMKVQSNSIMSIPDGKPLSLVGRKHIDTMDRVTGPDLMREVFGSESARGKRHYFYGNSKENLTTLIEFLKDTYPGIVISGYEPSVFRDMTKQEEQALVDRINGTNPDYVWIAIGAPRQENLCFRLKGRVNALMIGVGGAFNVIAGITPEAPMWMKNACLEWLYRLLQEPNRLIKRYVTTNSKFIAYLLTKCPPKQTGK